MPASNRKVHSGNLIEVTFDGKRVGVVNDLTGSEDYALDAASGIGDHKPVEWVPGMARITVRATFMVLKADTLASLGLEPDHANEALLGNTFDIAVFDNEGRHLKTYKGCSFASGDVRVTRHAIVIHDAVFNCLDVMGNLRDAESLRSSPARTPLGAI